MVCGKCNGVPTLNLGGLLEIMNSPYKKGLIESDDISIIIFRY